MTIIKNEEMTLFDLDESFVSFRPIKSNDWKWSMEKDYPKQKNGLKVFSCFACGGGSTMGYKLAGCEVIGDLEIDPKMNAVYVENHHPKHNYLIDIREFNKLENLPQEMYELDILDASPPCTCFSMAGDREKSWGKKKKFREGQSEQTLDDLFFVTIETINKLKPKVAIMENVEGMLKGNAFDYVVRVHKELEKIGYKSKHYLLKGEYMGVPQTRHRVFFICVRNDIEFDFDNLDMSFNYEPIVFETIKEGIGEQVSDKCKELLNLANINDKCLADVLVRVENRCSRFNEVIVWGTDVCPTIHNYGSYRGNEKTKFSIEDYRNVATFPQDYSFIPNTASNASYIVGMSVPPLMIKRVMDRLIKSGLFNYKIKQVKGE